jgi:Tfp pilus assembly protein PilN
MVPRVHINLSAPGVNYLRLTQFGLNLLTVGALTLTASFWWLGSTLNQQIDLLENQVSSVKAANEQLVTQAKIAGLDLSYQAIRNIPPQVIFVKQVRERVGFSWTQLLSDLETAIPPDITMNSVSHDEKTDTILLQGSAKSLPDLNRLIHQLDKHAAFQNVMLSQHASKNKKDAQGDPHIMFSLKASYASKHLAPNHKPAPKHQ